jgi:hypothetical protein
MYKFLVTFEIFGGKINGEVCDQINSWLRKNIIDENWSQGNRISNSLPSSILSFRNSEDAIKFQLTWGHLVERIDD